MIIVALAIGGQELGLLVQVVPLRTKT